MKDTTISPPIRRGIPSPRLIDVDPEILDAARQAVHEKAVVVVHCTIPKPEINSPHFVQRSTYLKDRYSGHRSKLLHAEGIAHPPRSTHPVPGKPLHFTLYFEALPAHCAVFDLAEHTHALFPFNASGLVRDRIDVYRVTLHERTRTDSQ